MHRSASPLLVGWVAALVACTADDDGHLRKDTTWSGEVVLHGDVVVEEGVTLTIEPGTTVWVTADTDDTETSFIGPADDMTTGDPTADPAAGGHDFERSHINIVVWGAIDARGTAEEPIRITSTAETPYYTDWVGITLVDGRFEYTQVEWCLDCIYALGDFTRLTLDHVHVRHAWAACTGFNPAAEGAEAWIHGSTIEDCGHEAVDTHDPGDVTLAWNVVRDSQVGFNLHGAMDADVHNNLLLDNTSAVLVVDDGGRPVVHLHQNTIRSTVVDPSGWVYEGYTMPTHGDQGKAVFVEDEGSPEVGTAHNIAFDSDIGFANSNTAEALVSSYNNMDAVGAAYVEQAVAGPGDMAVDSLFVDREGGDYRLSEGSPCRGAGDPAAGAPDLGAWGGQDARDELGWTLD